MKKTCYISVGVMLLMTLLLSCATIERPETKAVKEKPEISKTIQQEKSSIGTRKGLKRKVAIDRFTNETKRGQGFFTDKYNDRIGKQAVDILSAKLLETEKFILLERADLNKINKELNMENGTCVI
jgi:curli biogenesis system outer membrane secretion channel CsgG